MDEGLQEFFKKELEALVEESRKEAFESVLAAILMSLSSKKGSLSVSSSENDRLRLKTEISLLEKLELWMKGLAGE